MSEPTTNRADLFDVAKDACLEDRPESVELLTDALLAEAPPKQLSTTSPTWRVGGRFPPGVDPVSPNPRGAYLERRGTGPWCAVFSNGHATITLNFDHHNEAMSREDANAAIQANDYTVAIRRDVADGPVDAYFRIGTMSTRLTLPWVR